KLLKELLLRPLADSSFSIRSDVRRSNLEVTNIEGESTSKHLRHIRTLWCHRCMAGAAIGYVRQIFSVLHRISMRGTHIIINGRLEKRCRIEHGNRREELAVRHFIVYWFQSLQKRNYAHQILFRH